MELNRKIYEREKCLFGLTSEQLKEQFQDV